MALSVSESSIALDDRRFFIPIILGTVRRGRQSTKVAKFALDRMRRCTGRHGAR